MNSSAIAEWFGDRFEDWSTVVIVFLVILAVLVVNLVIRKVLDAFLRRSRPGDTTWRDAFLDALGPPLRAMVWIVGLTVAVRALTHEEEASLLGQLFPPTRDLAVIAVITWFLIRSVHRVERGLYARAQAQGRELDVTASDAISKLVRASIVITAVLVAMQTLGFSISGILAFGGIGWEVRIEYLYQAGLIVVATGMLVATAIAGWRRRTPGVLALCIGVLFGLGGALGQASGLIASKKGLEGDFSALSGNLMRLTVATLVIWALAAANGQMRPTAHKLREHPRAIRFILGGAVAGPFLGVWLSLIAVQNAPVGVASTLMSLTPVFLLPLGWLFFKERITRRAVVGTALAVAGTAILFLS